MCLSKHIHSMWNYKRRSIHNSSLPNRHLQFPLQFGCRQFRTIRLPWAHSFGSKCTPCLCISRTFDNHYRLSMFGFESIAANMSRWYSHKTVHIRICLFDWNRTSWVHRAQCHSSISTHRQVFSRKLSKLDIYFIFEFNSNMCFLPHIKLLSLKSIVWK